MQHIVKLSNNESEIGVIIDEISTIVDSLGGDSKMEGLPIQWINTGTRSSKFLPGATADTSVRFLMAAATSGMS
jgi:hypothetical protein